MVVIFCVHHLSEVAAVAAALSFMMPSKDKKKKKKKKTNAVNSAKKDKDSVNTSGDRPKRNSPKPGFET